MPETAETEVPPLTADPPELETLQIDIDGEIGTLTLNRPDALNAMSPELIGELTTAAAWLADRAPIREVSPTTASTCPPRSAAALRPSTTPSSTSAVSPIP